MTKTTLKIALAGFGTGGKFFHAPLITATKELLLTHILTNSEENRQHAQTFYPNAILVSDYSNLLSNPEIDIIAIATPNSLHFTMAEQALKSGKHVVLDKPFTVTTNEGSALIALAQKTGKLLTVFHNRRWDGDYSFLKEKMAEQTLGKLVSFESHFDRFRKELKSGSWKETDQSGSGILYDLGSHLIDQCLQLFGLPKWVFADLQQQRPGAQATDFFELKLLYPSGFTATLTAGMLVRTQLLRYRIVGAEGTLDVFGTDGQEAVMRQHIFPAHSDAFAKALELQESVLYQDTEAGIAKNPETVPVGKYTTFYQNVADHLISNTPLLVTAAEALQTIKIIELARESHHKKCVVSVKF
ncbi:MAG: Gfo/Idh/MocA family oxidoreductase [Flavobacteriaceae bacterium]|nr:Gfo/Idh/MocA family oxidoreductase [Flavobacteriaceae bacterium]